MRSYKIKNSGSSLEGKMAKESKKIYQSPALRALGSMQKMTLGKTTSSVDNLTPGELVGGF